MSEKQKPWERAAAAVEAGAINYRESLETIIRAACQEHAAVVCRPLIEAIDRHEQEVRQSEYSQHGGTKPHNPQNVRLWDALAAHRKEHGP